MMFGQFDFVYTHAIVCRLPNTYKGCGHKKNDPLKPIEISICRAREQHTEYIAILRQLGLDVIELPADDTLPESVFVDCTAVICNGTALIARPHITSRRKEVGTLFAFYFQFIFFLLFVLVFLCV
jgi:dimethylargininase